MSCTIEDGKRTALASLEMYRILARIETEQEAERLRRKADELWVELIGFLEAYDSDLLKATRAADIMPQRSAMGDAATAAVVVPGGAGGAKVRAVRREDYTGARRRRSPWPPFAGRGPGDRRGWDRDRSGPDLTAPK